MKTSPWIAIAGVATGLLLATSNAAAQSAGQASNWSLGVTAGTLGIGPQVAFRPNANFGVRVNAAFFDYSRDEEVDDIDYDGDLQLQSYGAMLDWFPTGGGFRISAGGRINETEIELQGQPSSNVTVGDDTYTPAQVGTLSGTVTTDEFAPLLTIGYGGTLGKGFTFGAELGLLWQGKPEIDNLRATGLAANTPQFQADIQLEQQNIEDEIDDYELWPILQVELAYRF